MEAEEEADNGPYTDFAKKREGKKIISCHFETPRVLLRFPVIGANKTPFVISSGVWEIGQWTARDRKTDFLDRLESKVEEFQKNMRISFNISTVKINLTNFESTGLGQTVFGK